MNRTNFSLRELESSFGTWLSCGSSVISELASECGLDWLLFDLEHGCATDAGLLQNLQAIRGSNAAAIVRVGALHTDLVQRALDWGADGIMVPHVRSARDAEACVQAAHYPPRGRRGLSRSVRAYNYGLTAEARLAERREPMVMVQIESAGAVEQVEAIAKVPGVDVLFVGPADLAFDLSVRNGEFAHLDFDTCLHRVVHAAVANGKQAGILVRDVKDIAELQRKGFAHIAVDSDLGILRRGYVALREIVRANRPEGECAPRRRASD